MTSHVLNATSLKMCMFLIYTASQFVKLYFKERSLYAVVSFPYPEKRVLNNRFTTKTIGGRAKLNLARTSRLDQVGTTLLQKTKLE